MTADDIRARLDAIEAYCAAATEGPWWRREGYAEIDGQNYAEVLIPGPVTCGSYCYGGSSTIDGDRLDADLAFIAAARTDLPAVVAALRDALAERDKARGEVVSAVEKWVTTTAERDALAAENARLRAQVEAVEALLTDEWGRREHDDERCANCRRKWSKHGGDQWDVCANPERLAEFIGDLRAALATTEAGEES